MKNSQITFISDAQILIAMANIVKPVPICDRLIEASKFEYKTRHLIDGRIVQCDQRISLVAGYMSDEVRNSSPFTFMHRDDVRWVMVALRQSESELVDLCFVALFNLLLLFQCTTPTSPTENRVIG